MDKYEYRFDDSSHAYWMYKKGNYIKPCREVDGKEFYLAEEADAEIKRLEEELEQEAWKGFN